MFFTLDFEADTFKMPTLQSSLDWPSLISGIYGQSVTQLYSKLRLLDHHCFLLLPILIFPDCCVAKASFPSMIIVLVLSSCFLII